MQRNLLLGRSLEAGNYYVRHQVRRDEGASIRFRSTQIKKGMVMRSTKPVRLILAALFVVATATLALCQAEPSNGRRNEVAASSNDNGSPPAGKARASTPQLQRRNPRYQLCKGDVFDLSFPYSPEFNQQGVTVQPDGYISLLEVGDFHVEGKTVPEVTEMIQTAYSKILHNPVASIVLKDVEKAYFIVGGQVGKPGKYDLRGDTTVTQAVAIAGGFTDRSKHSQILLFRGTSNDWVEVKKIDAKSILQAKNIQEDIHLRPGDMIFVPQNAYSKIQPYIPKPNLALYFPWFGF